MREWRAGDRGLGRGKGGQGLREWPGETGVEGEAWEGRI